MFTFEFDENSRRPKYEQLYRHVRNRIASGEMTEGEMLPSKRKLAAHLRISLNTVENAYAQLAAEGFVEAVEKKGYFVQPVAFREKPVRLNAPTPASRPGKALPAHSASRKKISAPPRLALASNAVDSEAFPFSTWSRLMRDSLREDHAALVREQHPQGDVQLREQIADYLRDYRNMNVAAERIVVGAGTTYLIGMLTELLPKQRFAMEDPGYFMTARTFQSRNTPFSAIPVDDEGLDPGRLRKSGASVCVVTPSNQFPLCLVMSIKRRLQLLDWASEKSGRYIVEDDYDSDYRYALKPAPALHSLDTDDRVIYFNTFARTLTPSLRIAYMVLPKRLMDAYLARIQLYSCTVSGFEQRTLWRFVKGGYYERHLNRMRTIYKRRRNVLMDGLAPIEKEINVSGFEAGLHLIIRSKHGVTESELINRAAAKGVDVPGLSDFYFNQAGNKPAQTYTVIAGYGGLPDDTLKKAASRLCLAWKTRR